MEAIQRWTDAHSILKHAAADFLDACAGLQSVLASVQPFESRTNQVTFEDILHQIVSHIESITLVEFQVQTSRAMLNGFLNESTVRTPINKLPSEILGRVFAIAAHSSPCSISWTRYEDALRIIPQVCTKWRQVAINHSSLWCHVDVSMPQSFEGCGSVLNRVKLSINRSRGLPIHLHLSNFHQDVQKVVVSELTSILRPHAASYVSLEIFGEDMAAWVPDMLSFYSVDTLNCVKSLVLTATGMESDAALPGGKFGGLLYLSLCSEEHIVLELSNFAPVLSSCLELRTLILKNLWIDSDESYPIVHLPHLRLIQIINVDGGGAPELISMIHPGTHELDIRLDVNTDTGLFPSIHALLTRSNIISMTGHLFDDEACDHITRYLSAVPQLRSLILVARSRCTSLLLNLSMRMLSSKRGSPPHVPLLQSLCLVHGVVSPSHIVQWERIIETVNLRVVGFLSCRFPSKDRDTPVESDEEDESIASEAFGPEENNDEMMPESFKEWLSDRDVTAVVARIQTKQLYLDTDVVADRIRKV